MLSNDNRNRIFGASLVFAGIVGLIAPPVPAARAYVLDLMARSGVHITYVSAPVAPRPPRAPRIKVINAHATKMCLPRL